MADPAPSTPPEGTTPPEPVAGDDPLAAARSEAASWRRKLRDAETAHTAALDAARAEGRSEMVGHVLDARIVAGASGRFASVDDALKLLDRTDLVKGDAIDNALLADRLDQLASDKPHLLAKRFNGSADQGVRVTPAPTSTDWGRALIDQRKGKG